MTRRGRSPSADAVHADPADWRRTRPRAPLLRPWLRSPALARGRRVPPRVCDLAGRPARHSSAIAVRRWRRGSGSSGCRGHRTACQQGARPSSRNCQPRAEHAPQAKAGLGPSQSRPRTDARPGSARSPGLRVCRAAPSRRRNIHTHAPFRTERQSFLRCRDMRLTISREQRSGHAAALAGYAGFSFRDLAAEAGIRSASAHHHFPTKAAATVARRAADRFFDRVMPQTSETPDDVGRGSPPPVQHSTGGKQVLGKTSKMGQAIFTGAMVIVRWACRKGAPEGTWLHRMLGCKPRMLVAIALANKMARSIWAMLTKGEENRGPVAATL